MNNPKESNVVEEQPKYLYLVDYYMAERLIASGDGRLNSII